jgi:hypothetical protein
MGPNTSAWWATNIIIWALAMSGCSATRSAWIVFMDGKEAILIGALTPFAMIGSEGMPTDMSRPGTTSMGID